jgi:hypothetical protein
MARAMLLFKRQADASWFPTTVILATPKRLQGKCLPGDPNRDARLASILTNALPPRINDQTEERGTYEDWVTWGVYNLASGHFTWTAEVQPTRTVDELFQREVLDVIGVDAPAESSATESRDRAPEVEPSPE